MIIHKERNMKVQVVDEKSATAYLLIRDSHFMKKAKFQKQ